MSDSTNNHANGDRCWNTIGVWGEQTCPELNTWIHCQNCPVLGGAGRTLFEQPAPADYLEEWGQLLRAEQADRALSKNAILIFRLGSEWLGLSAKVFQSIEDPRAIHAIPHRSNKVLLGLVNIQGGLQLCISLMELLGITANQSSTPSSQVLQTRRLAFIGKGGDRWVFPVDEVFGVHRHHLDELQNVPVTVAKAAGSFTKAILAVEGRTVGLLDEELLFHHLKRNALK